jgi:hypothetical protein
MPGDEIRAINPQSTKGSFYGRCQAGNHQLDDKLQASIMSKLEYRQNNNRLAIGVGLGSVNTLSAEIGHEIRGNELGVDLYVKGERNKQLFKNTESQVVTLGNDDKVTLTNQYRPSEIRVGAGSKIIYRPDKRVKVGLGGEAGFVVPTTANNNVKVGAEKVSFRHSHLPEPYVTPSGSIEVGLDKSNSLSIVVDASMYDIQFGIQGKF